MQGYVTKRGKRIGSRVKRYMRLYGPILSNHHTDKDDPTWTVNISDAIITCSTKKNRVTIELFRNKLEIFTDTPEECETWYEALMNEKCKASLGLIRSPTGDNSGVTKLNNVKIVGMASNELALKRNEFSRGFKVIGDEGVENVVKKQSSSLDDSDDDALPPGDTLIVNGQPYEETPASMIFKQFNSPLLGSD